ncbi:MAG: hypothetical protein R6W71_05120 [Bacteroidales bacterium]|jgi:hypothetical protein
MTSKQKKLFNADAEYGVESRYGSSKERESEAVSLMEARIKKMKGLSGEDIIRAKLMQLKLKMEDYLTKSAYVHRNYFSEFLKMYIDTIYLKRSSFADDIDITPVLLSQIINNHREPNEEFFKKLMIHSEKVFGNVCEFQSQIWYQVYYREKLNNTLSTQDSWRPQIEEHVRISEPLMKYNKS